MLTKSVKAKNAQTIKMMILRCNFLHHLLFDNISRVLYNLLYVLIVGAPKNQALESTKFWQC